MLLSCHKASTGCQQKLEALKAASTKAHCPPIPLCCLAELLSEEPPRLTAPAVLILLQAGVHGCCRPLDTTEHICFTVYNVNM